MKAGCHPSLFLFELSCLCIVEAMVKMIQVFMENFKEASGIGYMPNVSDAERRRLAKEVVVLSMIDISLLIMFVLIVVELLT